MAQSITEEMNLQDEWYKEARHQTLETLPAFLNKLAEYGHDYGTICHALSAAACAAAWAMNAAPNGGITGFQAGFVMWGFVRHWLKDSNKCGMKLVDYDDMLYPQYDDKFDKTISPDTWAAIRKEAAAKLQEAAEAHKKYLADADKYATDIAAFVKKYPDYYERREHFDHLSAGTGAEWDAYYEKEKSGFEFAPREPYDPQPHPSVMAYWRGIVGGKVPFGYSVKAD